MRTTVTLEDDVASVLERIERTEGTSPNEVINLTVREYIAKRARKSKAGTYQTPTVDLGHCLVGSLDDVGEALASSEGENFR